MERTVSMMYKNNFYDNSEYQGSPKSRLDLPAVVEETASSSHKRRRTSKKGRKKTIHKMVVLALCCSAIGGAFGTGITQLAQAASGNAASTIYEGTRSSSLINVAQVNTEEEMTAAEIYALYVNATVGITTEATTNYFGHVTAAATSGSGFIITEDGYIVTNYHVIEGADTITVTDFDGNAYEAALVGYDESNDLAILKIEAEGLTTVVIGDSDNMNVGDEVIAIGNPLGELTFSLTSGSISALNREVTLSDGVTMELIQTDCAINSGNSGGALFNMYGEVIGITNAKYSSGSSGEASVDNIGFAIPINSVMDVIESIIETGYISSPYIGVSVSDVGDQYQSLGLPSGAAVEYVSEDSPAEAAGIQANDIITAVNGEEIEGSSGLKKAVENAEIGDTLALTVYRQGEILEISVTVEEQLSSAAGQETQSVPGAARAENGAPSN